MIPIIERHAKIAFWHLDLEAREEAIQETVCNAWQAYVRLVELGKTDVAYAIVRLDFATWLQSLPRRLRRVASFLANGETTTAAAKRFRVSQGRISQIRKELLLAWHRFQGEEPTSVVT